MIRVFIVDDEEMAQSALTQLLQFIKPKSELVGTARSVSESVALINKTKPDLVLMDIEIEGGTGFDVIQQLSNFSGKLVFTTAYSQYAVQAFKYSALDYLIKPIHSGDLTRAIEKAMELISIEQDYKKLVQVFRENQNEKDKKLVIKTSTAEHIVSVKDIIRIQADAAYCTFYIKDSKITVSKNLKYYAAFLDERQFVRCHQSHLVNIGYIASVVKGDQLKLKNGELIPISHRKKTLVLDKIRNA
ncbi:MAG TPA: response regulator transcription factor [Saprospiraceae bacterium]|nr:response regulator transcription factor [Saprospiraceae bacterium]